MTKLDTRAVWVLWLLCGTCIGTARADESTTQTVPHGVVWTEHGDAVYGLVFSPDGRWLASGSYDKTIKVWNVDQGQVVRTFQGHSDQVFRITASTDGDSVLSCSGDGSAIQWSWSDGEIERMVEGHGDPMMAVAYSPDGTLVATAGFHIQLWKGSEELWSTPHSQPFFSVAFSPDQTTLACGTENRVRFLKVDGGEALPQEIDVQGMVYQVEYSPGGRWLSVAAGKEIKVWDVKSWETIHQSQADASALFAATFSPDGKQLITGGRERVVRIWSVPELRPIAEFYGPTETILSLAVSPDGERIAAGTYDGTIYLWRTVLPRSDRSFRSDRSVRSD